MNRIIKQKSGISMKTKKILFAILACIDVVFLVISVITWDLFLSVCCTGLAIGLTYLYEDVGFGEFYNGKKLRKEYRKAKKAQRAAKKAAQNL